MEQQQQWILDFIISVGNMGAVNSQNDKKLFDWVQTEPHCYLNEFTGQVIEHHQIAIDSDKVQFEYNRRMKLIKPNIIQLLYYRKSYQCQSICSNKKQKFDVFIQGGLQKLNRLIKNINFVKKCYCNQIMRGFQNLKQYYGPFQVNFDMVWIDKQNVPKVWLNKNPFLNDFTPVKESLMVLQIKQILLKLNCNCNMLLEEQLIFENLTNKSVMTRITTNTPQFQYTATKNVRMPTNGVFNDQTTNRYALQKNKSPHFANKIPFYYPQTTQNKNYAKVPRPTSYFSQTTRLNKTENLNNSQKITFSRVDHVPVQVNHNNYKNLHASSQQHKNYSTYVLSNSKECSTPKVSFMYGTNSPVNKTPMKSNQNFGDPSIFSLNSNASSPQSEAKNLKSQLPFLLYEQQFGRKNVKKVTLFQNPTRFMQPTSSESINYIQNDNNDKNINKSYIKFQSQGYENQPYIPARYETNTMNIYKLANKSVISNQIEGSELEQVRQTVTISQQSIQDALANPSRSMLYDNPQTQRIWQAEKMRQDLFKMRNSSQSDKFQGRSVTIEYQMPQKTKRLVKKYLSATQTGNLQVGSIHQANVSSEQNSHNKLHEQDFLENNKYAYKDAKPKKHLGEHSNQVFLKSAKTINIQRNQQLLVGEEDKQKQQQFRQSVNFQRIKSTHTTGSYLQQHEKQQLKRQMQLVFNNFPQQQEQNKIKRKVAQKKAIFADLKAEAIKILQK